MAHKYNRNYNDDFEVVRYRKSPREGGRRGRAGISKNRRGRGGGGGLYHTKAFEYAVKQIHGSKFHDVRDFEEFREQDPVKWHKLSVIFGSQLSKEWIANKIKELCDEDLKLVNFQNEGRNIVAYLHTRDSVVKKLRRESYNFVDTYGKRLTINTTAVNEPSVTRITDAMENEIKICLNNRFSFETKVLDLSSFNKDAHLESVDLYLPLSRHVVAQYVSRMLLEILEELDGLNLSNNQLETLIQFKPFAERFHGLKMVDVSFNRLKHDGTLEVFKECSLIERIDVQGNPFFRSQNIETYGTIIRRRFPNLLKLNGRDLPPRIRFGVEESGRKALPTPILGHFPSDEMKVGILTFLQSYFEKYDSGKRDALMDMYTSDAMLTICAAPGVQNVRQKCSRYPNSYFDMSRNLLRVRDDERRKKMICHGKLQAVSALDRLPKTEHFLDSFRVDVLYNNETTIFMNVTGVYKELEEHGHQIRLFTRTFQVEAPQLIKIDNLMISHPSIDTDKKFRDVSKVARSPDAVVSPPSAPTTSYPSVSQDDLVKRMIAESGMNEMFSRQCLADYDFDFQEAMKAFIALKNANKIPPDAFN